MVGCGLGRGLLQGEVRLRRLRVVGRAAVQVVPRRRLTLRLLGSRETSSWRLLVVVRVPG